MKYGKMLIPPFTPGRGVTDDRWRIAFGSLGPRDRMREPEEEFDDGNTEKVRKALEEQDG